MSGDLKPKGNTNVSSVFSLAKGDFAEGGIPGVTSLINPEVAKMRAQEQNKKELTEMLVTKPATPSGSGKSLSEMGVHYVLEFKTERGEFRYSKFKPHGKKELEAWQTHFFNKMTLSLKSLDIITSFQEFAGERHLFQQEAFGADKTTFVQVVRIESDQSMIYVLFSSRSLMAEQEAVKAVLSAPAGSDDAKIELAA